MCWVVSESVNFALTGPICARAANAYILLGLDVRGHHDR
jgi:hypothetical protein